MGAPDPEPSTSPTAAEAAGDPVTDEEERLLDEARRATERAHAPYSGVRVGAALLDTEGRVHLGVNVENASYGLTLCAERTALARAVADGVRGFVAIAVHADTERAFPPCGACRQVLAELGPRMRVVWRGAAGPVRAAALDALLPDALGPDDLPDRARADRSEARSERAGDDDAPSG